MYELRVGSETFRVSSDPTYVKDRLERWLHFLFEEFLPKVSHVIKWQSEDLSAKLRARGATPCPECRRAVLPRVGAMARTVTE
jgi:hypothetical protein